MFFFQGSIEKTDLKNFGKEKNRLKGGGSANSLIFQITLVDSEM
jgi:hypothetical protein